MNERLGNKGQGLSSASGPGVGGSFEEPKLSRIASAGMSRYSDHPGPDTGRQKQRTGRARQAL